MSDLELFQRKAQEFSLLKQTAAAAKAYISGPSVETERQLREVVAQLQTLSTTS